MTAHQVITALAAKYCAPEYAFLTEVRNSVGFQRKIRTADAMAMSLWPSRGLYMTGFEVKVSRADWKKELEQPDKAEEMARFCKQWFVACPAGLIEKDEVPPGWGLIAVKPDGKISYAKPAPEIPGTLEPTWMLFGSLMRDVVENWVPQSLVEKRIMTAKEEYRQEEQKRIPYELKQAKHRLAELEQQIGVFETASGIKLDRYSDYFNKKIGEAVACIRHWSGTPADQLAVMHAQVERLAREILTTIEAIASTKVANDTPPLPPSLRAELDGGRAGGGA